MIVEPANEVESQESHIDPTEFCLRCADPHFIDNFVKKKPETILQIDWTKIFAAVARNRLFSVERILNRVPSSPQYGSFDEEQDDETLRKFFASYLHLVDVDRLMDSLLGAEEENNGGSPVDNPLLDVKARIAFRFVLLAELPQAGVKVMRCIFAGTYISDGFKNLFWQKLSKAFPEEFTEDLLRELESGVVL